ncbi:hypothetical protein EVAR_76793_1 [Eumeta japonica]|uniref:Uncharacterized protein n=1 Tax=Eumeta variegata TaxID=151549 RepID=A0A4C1STT9_EUMVA|nr:hypothetical protein EVAR_76793_1 [Eumeta japonica]
MAQMLLLILIPHVALILQNCTLMADLSAALDSSRNLHSEPYRFRFRSRSHTDCNPDPTSVSDPTSVLRSVPVRLAIQLRSDSILVPFATLCPTPLTIPISLPVTIPTQTKPGETKQMTGAVRAGTPRAGRRDSPQHAAPTDGQNVIMYSDEFGRSMGLQFSRRLAGKDILNICMPGASHDNIYWKKLLIQISNLIA